MILVELNAYLAFFVGLVMLSVCGDWLVTGAARLGKIFKLSAIFIGVCIIGFGTSLPEMLATASAAIKGSSGLALGNVVGSNIANLGFILAVGLLLSGPTLNSGKAKSDFIMMMVATAAFISVCFVSDITKPVALAFLVGLCVTLWLSMKMGQKHYEHETEEAAEMDMKLMPALLLVAMGLLGLFAGAEQLVNSAIVIAGAWGVPEKVIGLTMVAIGTSLPELAATISAARRGEGGMILGNVLGSNIFNLLGAAAVGGLFAPIVTAGMELDMLVMGAFSLALLPLFLLKKPPFKLLSFGLLTAYLAYITFTAFSAA